MKIITDQYQQQWISFQNTFTAKYNYLLLLRYDFFNTHARKIVAVDFIALLLTCLPYFLSDAHFYEAKIVVKYFVFLLPLVCLIGCNQSRLMKNVQVVKVRGIDFLFVIHFIIILILCLFALSALL